MRYFLLGFSVCIGLMPAAWAQEESRRPSAEEILNRLTVKEEAPRTRGFKPESLDIRGVKVEGRVPVANASTASAASIDLEVNFEYGSATLTPDARLMLDNLGKALSDPKLKTSRFLVAGHTDAAGGDAYNKTLSKRRAQAVADYLTKDHGVEANRLQVDGFGRNKLLDNSNPLSAMNRRVQVANLGAQ